MNAEQREELLQWRRLHERPLHEPPHYPAATHLYFITAACYEHAMILNSEDRRRFFAGELLSRLNGVHAWVVLPNHYHLVLTCDLKVLDAILGRLHNWTSTMWNREDHAVGRQVWYRFADRRIRSQRHYFASVNYTHYNPVKHGWHKRLDTWPTSSFVHWLDRHGRDEMIRIWRSYPIRDYGKTWDHS